MRDRHLHYNDTLDYVARQEKAGNAFVLRPSEPITVSRTEKDYDKLYALYQNGYEDMKRADSSSQRVLIRIGWRPLYSCDFKTKYSTCRRTT